MSALCAFPPLIPAGGGGGGGVYSAGYMADVSSSSNRGSSFSAAYSNNAMTTSQRISSASIPAYGSTFAAFPPTTTGKSIKMTQPESAWSSRTTSDVPPAAKRRCTDKMRSTVWSDQAQIWPASSSIPASVCPSGCTMCHLQRQQQQQQQQHYPSLNNGFQQYDCRRPLQEKHQNREEVAGNMAAVLKSGMKSADATTTVRMPNVNRSLSVDPKKDYSAPLHVDCSVEYDLPRIVRPPPGAQPLLILAPPRPSAVPLATPTGYQTWTANSLSHHPPHWNQQGARIKSDKPSAASVKSHPAAMQQQKLNSTTISGAIRNNSGGGVACGCPSCCLAARPSLPPHVYAGPTGVGGGAGWMNQHWSPPAGATASSAGFNYAPPQQQQQQQQQQQPTYQQMAAFHNIDQQPQQPQTVINRRRKRSPEVIPSSSGGGGGMSTTSDKMQRLYSTAQWMPNPSSIQAAAEAAFVAAAAAAAAAASHRYVTSSPAWMHASAQPLKFHC
ncbi:hypothetical protein GHT06_012596 [Daphnia sinensis]|uniref:Uncharacterized protein n=1 Tax=Daphnia sinensis TaxID=1820382 RepID=A0AAD5KW72_9CRUS|nr:hypothetical protein GHT06_012596 [Daphnia sinensis]